MSTVHGGPGNIVTNGLVLNLNAANPRSYAPPYTGTTWTDLSGNGNNGTLTNGPTFNSSNGGSIVFDGVDDWVVTNYQPNFSYQGNQSFSIGVWFYLNLNSYSIALTSMRNSGAGWVWAARSINSNIVFSWWNGTSWSYLNALPTQNIPTGQWNLGNIVYEPSTNILRFYLNGLFIGTLIAGTIFAPTSVITLIRWDGGGSGYSNPQQISMFSVYNRALTAQEVSQNFNATRARFGI